MKNEHASEFVPQAVEYLTAEKAKTSGDRYQKVVCTSVCDALLDFCRQDAEFAQAVAQKKDFAGCLAAAVKGASAVGGLSDLAVYSQAAAFYFPGAKINFVMTIDLVGDAAGEPCAEQKPKHLELSIFDIL